MRDDDLVTVDRFLFVAEAELARARLEAAGIDAVLADENVVRLSWGDAQAHGGVRLQVRRHDAEAAREVLDDAGEDEPIVEDAEPHQERSAPRCRRCFSEEVYPVTNRVRVFAGALLASMLFPLALGVAGIFVQISREMIAGMLALVLIAPPLAIVVSAVSGRKRCRKCGLEWR